MRSRRLSLDGTWAVQLEPGEAPREIVVPYPFEAPLSGIGLGGEVHERLRCPAPLRRGGLARDGRGGRPRGRRNERVPKADAAAIRAVNERFGPR